MRLHKGPINIATQTRLRKHQQPHCRQISHLENITKKLLLTLTSQAPDHRINLVYPDQINHYIVHLLCGKTWRVSESSIVPSLLCRRSVYRSLLPYLVRPRLTRMCGSGAVAAQNVVFCERAYRYCCTEGCDTFSAQCRYPGYRIDVCSDA